MGKYAFFRLKSNKIFPSSLSSTVNYNEKDFVGTKTSPASTDVYNKNPSKKEGKIKNKNNQRILKGPFLIGPRFFLKICVIFIIIMIKKMSGCHLMLQH